MAPFKTKLKKFSKYRLKLSPYNSQQHIYDLLSAYSNTELEQQHYLKSLNLNNQCLLFQSLPALCHLQNVYWALGRLKQAKKQWWGTVSIKHLTTYSTTSWTESQPSTKVYSVIQLHGFYIFAEFFWFKVMIVLKYSVVSSFKIIPHWRPGLPHRLPWCQCSTTLNTGSLSGCIPLGSAAIQRLDYAPCCCNKTTTFFSSCWSPSGPASHRTGRRLPALSSPRPSRHTGTTPCFPSENHIRLCPSPLALLPSGFWEEEREEEVTQCTVCGKGDKVIYLTSYWTLSVHIQIQAPQIKMALALF